MVDKNNFDKEQVVVVTIKDRNFQYSVAEVISLVENLHAEVIMTITMHRDSFSNATYLGKGKIEEVSQVIKEFNVETIVINDNISPLQKQALEEQLKCKVLDRTEIILSIFSARASSKEAQLQVELAELQYLSPRLTRMWGHLSRQKGGIGMKGIGEKQLETDKRVLRKKVSKLKDELKKVKENRSLLRKKRMMSNTPVVSLVGYTNAGKSTMFNYFKGKEVFAKDQLFATLDTITKKVSYENAEFYIVDTVGFINNLPHFLIESFKATLEEVMLSDLLIHVVDASSKQLTQQIKAVYEVLHELGIDEKPMITVYNKIDLVKEKEILPENGLHVSLKTGENLDLLVKKILEKIKR
ncbi:MAG: GTPase HflX [Candidatus Margulisbacteria bacterium]|nr:GTPase HflX [Candidatus Margulisiibacteriota bacterium]